MEQYQGFDDVNDGYWAAEYIKDAAIHGWVEGYGDGTFRADDPIDRAEVVTIVNRLLGREADEDYIADNYRRLVTFPDVSSRHWAYYQVLEAANATPPSSLTPKPGTSNLRLRGPAVGRGVFDTTTHDTLQIKRRMHLCMKHRRQSET